MSRGKFKRLRERFASVVLPGKHWRYPSTYADDGFKEVVDPMRVAFDNWIGQFPGEERNRIAACERLIEAKTLDEARQALDEGAFVDCYTRYYKFPTRLSLAACHGDMEEISLLVERGAWIDDPIGEQYGFGTPFETAYYQHQYEAAIHLLGLGANPNAAGHSVLDDVLEEHVRLDGTNWPLVDAMVAAGATVDIDRIVEIRKVAEETLGCIGEGMGDEKSEQDVVASLALFERLVLAQTTSAVSTPARPVRV